MATLMLKLTSSASLRGMVSPDGMHVYAVYDFICLATQRAPTSSYGRVTYGRLISDTSEFKDEIVPLCNNLHFPGGRGAATPTMTIRGLQRLLMILGGKVAAEFRVLAESTFTRVMAGDNSLIEVIKANALSESPVTQAFRQAMEQEPIATPPADHVEERRKRNALFEMEMRERICKTREAEITIITAFSNAMSMLNPDWKRDTRLRLSVEDSLKTSLLGSPALAITDGAITTAGPQQSVSVGEVAQKLGVASRMKHGDSIAIGKAVAKAYLEKHGERPPKHRQWVDGAEREVNSYTEADRKLIEKAIRARMLQDEASTAASSDSEE